ncbi:hypothetical protein BCR44DRAFT_1259393 [Catenaria anguillulae PL171]|uniref:G-protein coupled receptors family 3 profile domain-containing protein n=1 Tax=Catenaria anguillulae PL171 TaxID=765915 RepID=A0A1Y2HD81_9FUNG|nr:hypothetical protein BCR44DRAFT_1259393 [Catenaria anguillulae PL171]
MIHVLGSLYHFALTGRCFPSTRSASSKSLAHPDHNGRMICQRIRPISHRHSRFQHCWHHLQQPDHQHSARPFGREWAPQPQQPSRLCARDYFPLMTALVVTAPRFDLGQCTQPGYIDPRPPPAPPVLFWKHHIIPDIRCMTHAGIALPGPHSFRASQIRASHSSSTTATPPRPRNLLCNQWSSRHLSLHHLFLLVAIFSSMPRGSAATSNLEIRDVPRCSRAYEVGQGSEPKWLRDKSNESWHFAGRNLTMTIEADPWKSAELTGILTTTLLRDVMGVNATFVYASGSGDLYKRISNGQVHFNVEVWSNDKLNEYQEHVVKQGKAEDFGLIGYDGQSGIYLTRNARTLYPDLNWTAKADILLKRPEILSLLPRLEDAGPTARFNNGTFVCSETHYPWCKNGIYTPPQCSSNPGSCRVLYMPHPSYTVGLLEQLVATHDLPLIVVYKSEAWVRSELPKLSATNSSAVFFWWSPDPLTERPAPGADEPYIRLGFADFDPGKCFPETVKGKVGQAGVEYKCDWPEELLKKVGSPRITRGHPQVATFLRQLMLSRTDIMELLTEDAKVGNTTAVCDWIGRHVDRWRRWVPPPPTGHYKTIVPVSQATQPILSIVLVSAILTTILVIATSVGLHRWSQAAPIRAQSPPFMQQILLGVLLMLVSVYFEVLTPSAPICSTRIWLLSLGLTIVTSSILVKTWRIFQIVANRELKVRIRREVLVAAMVRVCRV